MHDLLPVIGVLVTLGPPAVWAVSYSPLGKAFAARLKGKTAEGGEEMDRLTDAFEELQRTTYDLHEEISDLNERVAFAERLLSSGQKKELTPV